MNKLLIVLMLLALMCGASLAEGENEKAPEAAKPVKTMLDYRKELGLTEEQVKEVADALKSFQATVMGQRAALKQQEADFKALLAAEAPLSDIKAKLRQISDTRFQLRYADVLTSRRVSGALKPEQMKKWREIQVKVRGQK